MKNWEQLLPTEIVIAVHVKSGSGKKVHTDRPSHGLVLNAENSEKRYVFSDGTILEVGSGALFYLPKDSTYQVEDAVAGDCFAINFQAEGLPKTVPFAVSLRDADALERCFREACRAWKEQRADAVMLARHCIYEAVLCIRRERDRAYLPSGKADQLLPAMDILQKRYTDPALQMRELAAACRISDAYFRRLFGEKYGVTPHEYLARMRMTYAAQLLESRQFTVDQIAALCGFAEPCHFSREFRRRFGVSPMQYKKTGGIS